MVSAETMEPSRFVFIKLEQMLIIGNAHTDKREEISKEMTHAAAPTG